VIHVEKKWEKGKPTKTEINKRAPLYETKHTSNGRWGNRPAWGIKNNTNDKNGTEEKSKASTKDSQGERNGETARLNG